jgi:CHAT domain-containing protein/tetratricopeptide (TPR) repeat protein
MGEALEREIRGGEIQSFSVLFEAGQYARIVIERRGVDLLVNVAPPDRRAALRYENPAGAQSPVFLHVISDVPGDYTVEVRTVDKWSAAGRYSIRLEEVRAPVSTDEKRLEAVRRLATGRRGQLAGTKESLATAIDDYKAALAFWDEAGEDFEAANALHFMAQTHKALNQFAESVSCYEKVLERRATGDPQAVAYTLLDIAATHRDLHTMRDALPLYEKALLIFREAHNRRGEALTLYNTGFVHARLLETETALKYYQSALALHRAEGDRYEEARTLNAIGGAYDNLLQPQAAMDSYEHAIKAFEAIGDLVNKGNTLNGIGKLLDDFGEWQKALEHYNLALDNYSASEADGESDKASIRSKRATTLYNIAYTYITFNEWQKALDYLQQSLALREGPSRRGIALLQIAYVNAVSGKPQLALDYCQQALALLSSTDDPRAAQIFTVMGIAYNASGKHQKALEMYERALNLQRNPKSPHWQAQPLTLSKMGEAHAALGETDKALKAFDEARKLYHSFGERNGEALALFNIARVEESAGNHEASLKRVETVLEMTEPLRSNITSRELRASYFTTKISYYELYINLKMRRADDAETAAAFEASERARARSLLDLLADASVDAGSHADAALAALVEKRRRLLLEMRAGEKRRLPLALEKYAAEEKRKSVEKDKTRGIAESGKELAMLDQKIAKLEREIALLDSGAIKHDVERNRLEAQIKSGHPRYASLLFPQPLKATEVRRLLDPDTLLLEFFLGDTRSYVWALTQNNLSGHPLPPRGELETAARRLKELLWKGKALPNEGAAARRARMMDSDAEYWREAAALSRTLLGPVAAQLKGKKLIIVADGELMYLPFGALPSPDAASVADAATGALPPPTPLILEHVVVNLPSASVLAALRQTSRRSPASKSVAIFADPVFESDDPRIEAAQRGGAPSAAHSRRRDELAQAMRDTEEGGDGLKLSRLPASNDEARHIMSVANRGSIMEAIGFKATRENATDPRLGQYNIVHFATHGILNEKHPELSGLVLSLYDERGQFHGDGFLRLSDIYGLSLPVDLVVLSACRTGLGREVRGEGLIGLTRGFMYAGSARVVASLWKVDDAATAELMKHFYQKMLKEGLSPAAALREAQVSLAGQKRWSSPYYWAAFGLQGDWK